MWANYVQQSTSNYKEWCFTTLKKAVKTQTGTFIINIENTFSNECYTRWQIQWFGFKVQLSFAHL